MRMEWSVVLMGILLLLNKFRYQFTSLFKWINHSVCGRNKITQILHVTKDRLWAGINKHQNQRYTNIKGTCKSLQQYLGKKLTHTQIKLIQFE